MKIKNLKYSMAVTGLATVLTFTGLTRCSDESKNKLADEKVSLLEDELDEIQEQIRNKKEEIEDLEEELVKLENKEENKLNEIDQVKNDIEQAKEDGEQTKEDSEQTKEDSEQTNESYDLAENNFVRGFSNQKQSISKLTVSIPVNDYETEIISEKQFVEIFKSLKQAINSGKITNIRELTISNCDFTQYSTESVELFNEVMSSIEGLFILDLQNLNLNDNSILFLNDCKFSDTLFHCNLNGNKITNIDFLKENEWKELKILSVNNNIISNIDAIANATIEMFLANYNNISDISSLANCDIEDVSLIENQIIDISPLATSNIKDINLSRNQIIDISPLATSNIKDINLSHNQIVDISTFVHTRKTLYDMDIDVSFNYITDFSCLDILSDDDVRNIEGGTIKWQYDESEKQKVKSLN